MNKKGIKQTMLVQMAYSLIEKKMSKEEAEVRDELLQELPLVFENYDKIVETLKNNPDLYKEGEER